MWSAVQGVRGPLRKYSAESYVCIVEKKMDAEIKEAELRTVRNERVRNKMSQLPGSRCFAFQPSLPTTAVARKSQCRHLGR